MKVLSALVLCLSIAISATAAGVFEGDPAPLYVFLDQNMRRIDMADLLKDRPLVFWQTSAT